MAESHWHGDGWRLSNPQLVANDPSQTDAAICEATERARDMVSDLTRSSCPASWGSKRKTHITTPVAVWAMKHRKGLYMKIGIAAEVKAKADCREIFKQIYPDKFHEQGNSVCPFHEDKSPSLQVTKERAFCHDEKKSWDAIELVREAKGLNFNRALTFLADMTGIGISFNPQKTSATVQPLLKKSVNSDTSGLQGPSQPRHPIHHPDAPYRLIPKRRRYL